MSDDSTRCSAVTQSGNRCKLKALEGAEFCHIHAKKSANGKPAAAPKPALKSTDQAPARSIAVAVTVTNEDGARGSVPAPRSSQVRMEMLRAELDELAAELRRRRPDFHAPPFSPTRLQARLKQTVDKVPGVQLANNLRQNLQGTTTKDLVDPDTWKGLWYILSYTAQMQAQQTLARLRGIGADEIDADVGDASDTKSTGETKAAPKTTDDT